MSALCQKHQTLTDRLEKLPELLLGSCNQISGIASSLRLQHSTNCPRSSGGSDKALWPWLLGSPSARRIAAVGRGCPLCAKNRHPISE
jgi:hypothetical protein